MTMPSMNQINLIGRLVRDPETKTVVAGTTVCEFDLAVDEAYNQGHAKEVMYIEISAFNKMAIACAEYLKKGKLVLVSGRLKQSKWQDKATGQNRSKISVIAFNVQFLSPPETGEKLIHVPKTQSQVPETSSSAVPNPPQPSGVENFDPGQYPF